MSSFADNNITNAGRALLAQVQNGAIFTPTKIVMGSGYLPSGTTTRTITDVVTPEVTLSISKKTIGTDDTFIVGGVYSNQEVTTAFKWRELGLYVKAVDEDGDEVVAECLYSYGNAGDNADTMEPYTSGIATERMINVQTYIGNDTEVNLTIESNTYVTVEMINQPNGVPGLDGAGHIDISVFPVDYHSGGWVEMETSIPAADREDNTLYGLILADFGGSEIE